MISKQIINRRDLEYGQKVKVYVDAYSQKPSNRGILKWWKIQGMRYGNFVKLFPEYMRHLRKGHNSLEGSVVDNCLSRNIWVFFNVNLKIYLNGQQVKGHGWLYVFIDATQVDFSSMSDRQFLKHDIILCYLCSLNPIVFFIQMYFYFND